jgi:hypothetical protein
VLAKMKKEIPIILVKLEKKIPPTFFDVMIHLDVHLPKEALLRGLVQYGWMYPIESRLYTLKCYVWNRSRPEGSIAEAYVADECLTFCSKYLDDLDTRFNQEPRNTGFLMKKPMVLMFLGMDLILLLRVNLLSEDSAIDQMVWFVLNNCSQVEKYVEYVLVTILGIVVFYFCHAHMLIL